MSGNGSHAGPGAPADVWELAETVRRLTERVDELEARLRLFHPEDEVPEDVVLAIAAACAAYLGKRATVKQVRLRRHGTWSAQGRGDVQHSHALPPAR